MSSPPGVLELPKRQSLAAQSAAAIRKAGRPSLAGGSGTSPQVTFRLSPSVREQAERLAANRGTTVSALAREALEQLVRKAG